MKQIMIRLDLEDNEVLDAEVQKIIKDSVKQLTREQFAAVFQEELNKLIDKRTKEMLISSNWWVNREIKNQISSRIKEYLADPKSYEEGVRTAFQDALKKLEETAHDSIARIGMTVDSYIAQTDAKVSREIVARVNAALQNEISKNIMSILFPAE